MVRRLPQAAEQSSFVNGAHLHVKQHSTVDESSIGIRMDAKNALRQQCAHQARGWCAVVAAGAHAARARCITYTPLSL